VVSELQAFHDRLVDAARALDSIRDEAGAPDREPDGGGVLLPESTT
jgi:hypothetical protein